MIWVGAKWQAIVNKTNKKNRRTVALPLIKIFVQCIHHVCASVFVRALCCAGTAHFGSPQTQSLQSIWRYYSIDCCCCCCCVSQCFHYQTSFKCSLYSNEESCRYRLLPKKYLVVVVVVAISIAVVVVVVGNFIHNKHNLLQICCTMMRLCCRKFSIKPSPGRCLSCFSISHSVSVSVSISLFCSCSLFCFRSLCCLTISIQFFCYYSFSRR